MRVQIVDPPAYTPPYDRCLCAALARAGAQVELLTSPFAHASVPAADGYRVTEAFHRRAAALDPSSRARRPLRAAEHFTDMVRWRRAGADADMVHLQWSAIPALDRHLLPAGAPLAATAHALPPARGWRRPGALGLRGFFRRMDAVIALSEHGAASIHESTGIPPERIRVIPHGPFDYLTRIPDEAPLPADLTAVEGPVVLSFGLIRPYKAPDLLLEAFRQIEGAELWMVGRPLGVDMGRLRALAAACRSTVRFVPRFVEDREVAAFFRRADLVVLPYREAEQSGVLYTALPFGKAIVLSDVGGFGEVAAAGAGRLVPPGDAGALHDALAELVADEPARRRLGEAALAAAAGPNSWDEIARRHLALYRELVAS